MPADGYSDHAKTRMVTRGAPGLLDGQDKGQREPIEKPAEMEGVAFDDAFRRYEEAVAEHLLVDFAVLFFVVSSCS